jgi:ribosomal protein L6P/L9E
MSCVDYSRIVNQNIDTKGSHFGYFQSGIRNNQKPIKIRFSASLRVIYIYYKFHCLRSLL